MSAARTIVVMPGDGIGRVVVPEAIRVLRAAGCDAQTIEAEIGWEGWRRNADALPRRTVELLASHKLGLLGAITSKPAREAEDELAAHLRGTGLKYESPILALRRHFRQDICVRRARSFPGNLANFVRRRIDGSMEEPDIDIAVFRQNTEGLYSGVEWSDPPPAVRDALGAHPRFGPYRDVGGADLAIAVRVITRRACAAIVEAAFRHAAERGIPSITLAEKPNVLRETSGLFLEEATRVSMSWPAVRLKTVHIDAMFQELTRRPEEHRVIVASNLFGDVISDAVAGLTGGLGFACSANLGPEVSIFEPTHGSAPRHAAIDPPVANPIAAILAGALLAEHIGDGRVAETIRRAVAEVVAEGRVRTYDMLPGVSPHDAASFGAATTREMAEAVLSRVRAG